MTCLILASLLVVRDVAAQPVERVPVIVEFKVETDSDLMRSHGGEIKCEYELIRAVACSLPQHAYKDDVLKSFPWFLFRFRSCNQRKKYACPTDNSVLSDNGEEISRNNQCKNG